MAATYLESQNRRRTVLVVVLNNADDLRRAASAGWYRIPQRHAPKRIGADFLAFYQTGAFKEQDEAQSVTYFAPTRRYRLLTRRELLPEEANHPRAAEYYFQIEIGPLQRLERPIPALSFKRVTFIHTTLERLTSAHSVAELFVADDPFEMLWDALRAHQLRPLKNRLVGERPVDLALRARGGYLGVVCSDDATAQESRWAAPERWSVIQLSTSRIQSDLNGCLRQIGAALLNLGGSMLNQL